MRFSVLGLLFILITCSGVYAQQDSVSASKPALTGSTSLTGADSNVTRTPQHMELLDSVAMATTLRAKFVSDSLANMYVFPDSNRANQLATMLMGNLYKGHDFLDIPFKSGKTTGDGHIRKSRDPWILVIIVILLLYTALLNFSFGSDIKTIFQSFYAKRAAQFDKDDKQLNFRTFIGLFLLFSATFGLFLYQYASYKSVYFSYSGLQLFVALSLIVISLFAFKFLLLKVIGFLFDINRIVSEYITALYLTYFNIAFVFLPVAVCFSLMAAQFIPYLLAVALFLIVVIFVWIYLRSSVNIISNFRFHKFYLFIYLCALEICPILILIKVLNL
ncbi:DUF4271 domain-containing protein [Mucilaginibacter sp. X5P1]|uniref:DUF4271 domain-containing protein n=1 Tax=Mucilaginibacter sp. X5P1 TaxID=2723088 RepID=UPI0017BEE56D|nr:hypothetical protein [Mucilaginibacter sp. X5P1]